MDGEAYRLIVAGVTLVGLVAGLVYLWLYRPSRWRSAVARDSSGWVLALTLFFLWSLWRTLYAIWAGTPAPVVRPFFAWSSLGIGVLLVALVLNRLRLFLGTLRQERRHPTVVCTRCQGTGLVPRPEGA